MVDLKIKIKISEGEQGGNNNKRAIFYVRVAPARVKTREHELAKRQPAPSFHSS